MTRDEVSGKRFLRGFSAPIGIAALIIALAVAPAEAGKKQQKEAEPGIADNPNGDPMLLIVSTGQQKIDIYRGTTLVTSNVVSTGKPGYATKIGVFSILGKERMHHSNLYSGAPMPWMNRITWSGTALHAGVVPGYPASHGCIRLTYSFAPKLFQVTTVGDNVVVAQGRPAPEFVEHPALFQPLPPPAPPVVAKEPEPEQHSSNTQSTLPGLAAMAPKSFILAKADVSNAEDLVPHSTPADADDDDTHAATNSEERDPGRIHAVNPDAPADQSEHALGATQAGSEDHASSDSQAEASDHASVAPAPATSEPPAVASAPVSSEPAAVTPVSSASTSSEPSAPSAPAVVAVAPAAAVTPVPVATPAKPETPAAESATQSTSIDSAAANKLQAGIKAAALQAAEPRSTAPLRVLVTRRTERDRIIGVQNLLADLGYLDHQTFDGSVGKSSIQAIKAFQKANGMPESGAFTDELVKKVYEVAGKGEPPQGHIFVRQEFSKVFDAPVSFKNPDEPLGTHLYTAMKFVPGDTKTRWTVVNLQGSDPTAVLDRLEIPDDIRQKISERLTPGSSLIIADLSINSAALPKGGDFVVWAKDPAKVKNVSVSSGNGDGTPQVRKRRYRNVERPTFQYQQPWWSRGPW